MRTAHKEAEKSRFIKPVFVKMTKHQQELFVMLGQINKQRIADIMGNYRGTDDKYLIKRLNAVCVDGSALRRMRRRGLITEKKQPIIKDYE